jgi:hypothetical protein
MNITPELVMEAIDHASKEQLDEMCNKFDDNLDTWAGIVIGKMISEHIESLEDIDYSIPTEAEEIEEWKIDSPRG